MAVLPKRCPICKGEDTLRIDPDHVHKVTVPVAPDHTVTFEAIIPALVCNQCGEGSLAGPDLDAFDVLVAVELGRMGYPYGPAFRWMRKAIGLSSKKLATMLGIKPETLTRWENGRLAVPRLAFLTLAKLAEDELAKQRNTREQLEQFNRMERNPQFPERKQLALNA
jgi:DNA-binding XRE family transcriptional regulator